MRRLWINLLVFGCFALVGPLVWLTFGKAIGQPSTLSDAIVLVWPTWLLGALEYSVSSAMAWLISVAGNVVIYLAFGAIVSLSDRTWWLAAMCGLLIIGFGLLNRFVNDAYGGLVLASLLAVTIFLMLARIHSVRTRAKEARDSQQ